MTEARSLGGRYRILEKVGQGGVGAVYQALQQPLGRQVALKILRPEYSQNPVVRRRFTREARAVAALNHPNIATIFDFGVEPDGTLFIAMEYIDGKPLSALMRQGLTPHYLLAVLDPILAALAHAHARGVIHRDLKPDNILVSHMPQTGELPTIQELATAPQMVKLVDFGIATVFGANQHLSGAGDTRSGEVVGTPLYMSPEQARGERGLTPGVDLYTVGVVLYEGLTGQHLFAGLEPDETSMDIMIRHVTMTPPEVQPPAGVYVPEALRAIVRRCLRKKPQDRYGSAAQLREALKEAKALLQAHDRLQEQGVRSDGEGENTRILPALGLLDTAPDEAREAPTNISVSVPHKVLQSASSKLNDVLTPRALNKPPASSDPSKAQTPVEPDLQAEFAKALSFQDHAPPPDWLRLRADMRSALRGVRFEVPLVGRDDERRTLTDAVSRCNYDGFGQVILLEGPSGIGKTKLATWLGEHVTERGKMRFLPGAFLREDDSGLRGLRDILEGLFSIRRLARQQARERLDEQLRKWGLDDPRDAEALISFLRPADTNTLGGARQEALFALLVRTLERACRERPLLLLLDDIHWAGPVLGDFLEFLAVEFRYRPCSLLLLGTVRSEDLASNPPLEETLRRLSRYSGETVTRMALSELGEQECSSLIQSILPSAQSLKDKIAQRSQGNPLHVVQLLQYLYQEDLLRWDPDQGVFNVSDEDDAINRVPPDLADLLLLRFEQIEARHKGHGRLLALLERCAVLGDRFAFEVIDETLKQEENEQLASFLEEGIDILLQEAILTPVKGRGEDMLAFAHGLIREVSIKNTTGLLQSRRLHRLAAHAKERFYHDRLEVVAREIAHHYLQAGDRRKALDHLLLASNAARASYHLSDAVRLYAQAAELASQVPGIDEGLRFLLARRIGELREGFGQFHAASQIYAEMIRVALFENRNWALTQAVNQTEALIKPELRLLLEALSTSPRRAQLAGDALEEVVRGVLGLGRVLQRTGELENASRFFAHALDMATAAHLHDWIGATRLQLGRVAWSRGDYTTAAALGEEALQAAIEENNPHNRAEALQLLAEVARLRGDPSRTADLLTRAREAYEILGDRRQAALCLRNLALLARARHDLENAARLFAEARVRFEELGDRHAVASCFNGLGEVARFRNRAKVANSCYRRAFETFFSLGARIDAAISLTNLGMSALAVSDLKNADEALSQALSLVHDTTDHPYLALGLHLNTALLRAMQGHWDDANHHLTLALEESDKHPIDDPDYARPLEQLGNLLCDTGNTEAGEALIKRARQMWENLGLASRPPSTSSRAIPRPDADPDSDQFNSITDLSTDDSAEPDT